jgi:hypothetical protein
MTECRQVFPFDGHIGGEGMTATTSIQWIKKHGSTARGKRELIAFLRGGTLTMKESILVNCYQCTGFYLDGRKDCEVEGCPLHVLMPYRKGGAVKVRKVSEETKAKMRVARERKAQKIDSVAVG